jgi:hypothetical protein
MAAYVPIFLHLMHFTVGRAEMGACREGEAVCPPSVILLPASKLPASLAPPPPPSPE